VAVQDFFHSLPKNVPTACEVKRCPARKRSLCFSRQPGALFGALCNGCPGVRLQRPAQQIVRHQARAHGTIEQQSGDAVLPELPQGQAGESAPDQECGHQRDDVAHEITSIALEDKPATANVQGRDCARRFEVGCNAQANVASVAQLQTVLSPGRYWRLHPQRGHWPQRLVMRRPDQAQTAVIISKWEWRR
jgi:hypothetical protein